jgi:putative tricarboxylic transport membrane protein
VLKDLLTLEIKYSEYHLVFPRIILAILILLLVVMLAMNIRKRIQEKNFKFQLKFFKPNYDKLKFFGTIVLLILYVFALETIGFLAASILFMFIIMLLFYGDFKRKTIIVSIANAVTTSVIIWYLFGTVFNITLP